MRVAIASDHAGFGLKKTLIGFLRVNGCRVVDLGTHSRRPVDYPDYAEAVGLAIRDQRVDCGILICGSGVGASIAANKIPGVRAGICHDTYSAHQGVEHDNMNILTIGARVVAEKLSEEIVGSFLRAKFSKEPRHIRRLKKTDLLTAKYCDDRGEEWKGAA